MWILVVFYISTGTVYHEVYPVKGRDECIALKITAEKLMDNDPNIGVKHSLVCKKLDVA